MAQLSIFDYLVIIGYLIIVMGIGVYFLRRQKTKKDYFIADKRIPGWAMGMAIIATLVSNITFLANPGASYASTWVLFTNSLMVFVVIWPITLVAIPFYRNVIGMSLYEYFEKRFGYSVRVYGAIAFIFYYIAKLGVIFYVLALAVHTMTGWNIVTLILALGLITIVYTLVGGVEAVTWTDVIQGILLISGGVVCLGIALFSIPEGPYFAFNSAWEAGKFNAGEWSFSLKDDTILVMLLYGLFQHGHNFGTDQTMVQRYLTAKTTREAVRSALISGIACVPVWGLFFLVGTALWAFYNYTAYTLPIDVEQNSDQIFPYFIMTQLPKGVTGLVLVAVFASAMSTIAGGLNSLSTVFTVDLYSYLGKAKGQATGLLVPRIVVVSTGVVSLSLAIWLITQSGQVLDIYFTVLSIFAGGVLGLMLLGVLSKKANLKGVMVAIGVNIIFTTWASLTGNQVVDLKGFNYDLHPYLIGMFSHITIFVVGYLASFLFAPRLTEQVLKC